MQQGTRRYAILGSGALGGYYGALLSRSGLPVDFLCRGDYEHVRERGWIVESKFGDFRVLNPSVYRDVRDMPPADVVVVALKTTSNGQLASLLPPVVKPDGVVLVLQNGLGMEDHAASIVGPNRVIGGSCFLCSNKVGPGHIRHLDYGTIAMGEHTADGSPGGRTDRLRAIAADFEAAGVSVQISDDLRLVRWKKLVWNIPFNGLSVVLDASTSELVGDPSLRSLVRDLMEEIAGAAGAVGVSIEPEFLDSMIVNTERMVPYKTSMKVDYEGGRPLELDSIFGEPLRRAAAAGASMPITKALHRQLRFLDERNRKNRES
jgi:2-dehydropantoate 2-reductase